MVRHLIGPVAVMLLHALRVQKRLSEIPVLVKNNPRISARQLQAVPVAGQHIGRIALLIGQPRRRAQQVVGLVALHFKRGDMHGLQHLPHQGQLGPQLLGHGLAGAFVIRVQGMAEGGRVNVQHHAQRVGPVIPQRLQKHAEKAVYRVGVGSVLGHHQGKGVKGPKNQAVAVYQKNRGFARVAHEASIQRGMFFPRRSIDSKQAAAAVLATKRAPQTNFTAYYTIVCRVVTPGKRRCYSLGHLRFFPGETIIDR